MDEFGLVTLKFNDTLIVPSDLTEIDSSILEVQIRPYDTEMLELKGFTWEVRSFSKTKLTI